MHVKAPILVTQTFAFTVIAEKVSPSKWITI